ncbi:hypothetical protein FIBSPDRAFT_889030 [Athelia psychrophila]|uniref:Uncharacterized protein n=1 Tax=Athelia psychrophila TaxID=1759441 RepID=A0A166MUK6_9AGAM|nr:hypothetical protein FIBSPDRAFT_889030 [Fibularhizoctonia sp. CBS 109695]
MKGELRWGSYNRGVLRVVPVQGVGRGAEDGPSLLVVAITMPPLAPRPRERLPHRVAHHPRRLRARTHTHTHAPEAHTPERRAAREGRERAEALELSEDGANLVQDALSVHAWTRMGAKRGGGGGGARAVEVWVMRGTGRLCAGSLKTLAGVWVSLPDLQNGKRHVRAAEHRSKASSPSATRYSASTAQIRCTWSAGFRFAPLLPRLSGRVRVGAVPPEVSSLSFGTVRLLDELTERPRLPCPTRFELHAPERARRDGRERRKKRRERRELVDTDRKNRL